MMNLTSGQNIALSASSLKISLLTPQKSAGMSVDPSLFLLQSHDKIKTDDDFVFFNQPYRNDVGVALSNDVFTIQLKKVPADIVKMVLALTITDGINRKQSFQQLHTVEVQIIDNDSGQSIATFPLNTQGMNETALIMGEVYFRNGQWKFRALGKGFVGGLQPLAELYGVDIGEGEASAPPPPAPPKVESKPEIKPEPPAQFDVNPAPSVNLSKVTLAKKGDKISLEKKSNQEHGQVLINLNWTQGKKSLFGFSKAVDLDLGCLFEMQDGQKMCVQALGNAFGSLNSPPFIALDADDRTGAAAGGENLRINGKYWDKIKRVLVYAFIYEGVPNWSEANATVKIKTPDQPVVVIDLDSHDNTKGMCAIALFENVNGAIKITKLVDYKTGHQEVDKAYGWGMQWRAGSK
jgi:tellurite resistance protein TerA